MKKSTIQDVAKEAGVSITTVSRVVNRNYPVKESTRILVERAIQKLNFKPNMLAKGLIQKNTHTIGILTPSIENLFFSEVVKGVDSVMRAKGYTSFLCHTEGDPTLEFEMLGSLNDRQVDGIIMIDAQKDHIVSGYFEEFSQKTPLLLINGYSRDIKCNYVLNDAKQGVEDTLNYLIEEGIKRITLLRGGSSYSYDEKEDVYRSFMEKHGLKVDIISIGEGNDLTSVESSKDVVLNHLNCENPSEAILCCNDWMALGALNAAKTMGHPVPGRLRIIGFDNTIISQITEPKLSTVDQQMSKLGEMAANRLLEMITTDDVDSQKLYLETKLLIRES